MWKRELNPGTLCLLLSATLVCCADVEADGSWGGTSDQEHGLSSSSPEASSESAAFDPVRRELGLPDDDSLTDEMIAEMSVHDRRELGRRLLEAHGLPDVETASVDGEPLAIERSDDGEGCTTDDLAQSAAIRAIASAASTDRAPYVYQRPDDIPQRGVPAHVRGGEIIMPEPDGELAALYESYRADGCATEAAESTRACGEHPYRVRVAERRATPTRRTMAAMDEASEGRR